MPPSVSLPGVNAAVAQALKRLDDGAPLLAFTGAPGSGKSSALQELAKRVKKWHVVTVSLPQGDDAAPIGLITAAAQLSQPGQDPLRTAKEPRASWAEKLECLKKALDAQKDALLLLDVPALENGWQAAESIFSHRTQELTRNLLSAKVARKVIATPSVYSMFEGEPLPLESKSVPAEFLDAKNWNGFGDHATQVLSVGEGALSSFSPLELRLAVGLNAVGISAHETIANGWRRRELVRKLLDVLEDDDLKKVLGRLAILRLPFDEKYLALAGAQALEPVPRSILRNVLLFGENDHWTLHEMVAHEASDREWLVGSELEAAHRQASEFYAKQFDQAAEDQNVARSIRWEMEVNHHLIQAGDTEALFKRSLYFAQQYGELGKALSLKRRYPAAVTAYERAIENDKDDWYAHHYLAYNLDVQGRERDRVDTEYKEAIRLTPHHLWFHGRRVCFLVTVGRVAEAKEAWNLALARFAPNGAPDDPRVYDELHRQVARLLLHRGQLEFAERVLDDVALKARPLLDWYPILMAFLGTLREAEDNKLVFPPHVPIAERWSRPHLLRDEADLAKVVRWQPGRIARIDRDGVHVRVAQRTAEGEQFGWIDYSASEFGKLAPDSKILRLPVGTFVEIITLRHGARRERPVILPHESTRTELPNLLLNLHPLPDRYLRGTA